MIQAYQEPMAFTKNATLNPVLVISSKYPCHSNLIEKEILIQLTINPAYCHPDAVEGCKINFP